MVKCSDCSAIVKPVVAVDIDGTLGDYHGHFMRFASLYLGQYDGYLDAQRYNGAEEMRDWFCRITGQGVRTWRDIKLAYRQGAMKRSMPMYAHASGLVLKLREAGAEVWLTTTRPYLRLDNVDPDTRFWLQRNGIPYDGLLYDEDKYKVLAELIDPERVVAVLDDLPEQVEAAKEAFGESNAFFRRNEYNIANWPIYDGWFARDLAEALDKIRPRVERWRQINAGNV